MRMLVKSPSKTNDDTILQLTANNIVELYGMAEIIYTSHLFGYPGTLNKGSSHLERNVQSLEDLTIKIKDPGIRKLLEQIIHTTQGILINDKNMKIWVENLTGRSMRNIRKSSGLSNQMRNLKGEFTSDASLPDWTKEQQYSAYLENSSHLMREIMTEIDSTFGIIGKPDNTVEKE
jgi:hypothetical protein